jgi:phenylpyruvate tautomerase PptA (4-oxalocrotonate tautomerase family)
MPLVRIDLPAATFEPHQLEAIANVVYTALVDVASVPVNDKFVVFAEHQPGALVMDPTYMVERTDRALVVQITFTEGRTVDIKKRLYRAIADGLHEAVGQRTEDVFINLVEVQKENWSFGGGVAQYAD